VLNAAESSRGTAELAPANNCQHDCPINTFHPTYQSEPVESAGPMFADQRLPAIADSRSKTSFESKAVSKDGSRKTEAEGKRSVRRQEVVKGSTARPSVSNNSARDEMKTAVGAHRSADEWEGKKLLQRDSAGGRFLIFLGGLPSRRSECLNLPKRNPDTTASDYREKEQPSTGRKAGASTRDGRYQQMMMRHKVKIQKKNEGSSGRGGGGEGGRGGVCVGMGWEQDGVVGGNSSK